MANPNEYYIEDECTYYHEQAISLRSEEVVENQENERKEEQTKDLKEPYQEKEESTMTFSTLALIPETSRGQERSLLELPNKQIEDIKIEKIHAFSSYFIPVHDSSLNEKLFEKTQSGPPPIYRQLESTCNMKNPFFVVQEKKRLVLQV